MGFSGNNSTQILDNLIVRYFLAAGSLLQLALIILTLVLVVVLLYKRRNLWPTFQVLEAINLLNQRSVSRDTRLESVRAILVSHTLEMSLLYHQMESDLSA